MLTIEQEPIFTLHVNGNKLIGFKLISEWEGFKKFQRTETGDVVIVATSKAASPLHSFTQGPLKDLFGDLAKPAEYVPIVASPDLHDSMQLTQKPTQPDCRTCAQYRETEGICEYPLFHGLKQCTKGDKYEASPRVVLWRTE